MITMSGFELFFICLFFLVAGLLLGGCMDWYIEARRYHRLQRDEDQEAWNAFYEKVRNLEKKQ